MLFFIAPYLLSVNYTSVGELLPRNLFSLTPCAQLGGCFLAGNSRANENVALASMHPVWNRLHNFYAKEINILGNSKPNLFPSIAAVKLNRDKIIFEEARKIVIGI